MRRLCEERSEIRRKKAAESILAISERSGERWMLAGCGNTQSKSEMEGPSVR
jgi:hypothetical protein